MTKDQSSAAFGMLAYYANKYKTRYGKALPINKYKEKWAMVSLIEDFSEENVEKAIDYYFSLNKEGHPLNWFYNNCEVLIKTLTDKERDDRLRAERRAMTQNIIKEMNNVSS